MPSPTVGIDLGTTRSVIATLVDEKPVAIPDPEGQLTTPSVVAFARDGRPLVGRAAQRQAIAEPGTAVTAVKRLLGSEDRITVGDRRYLPQEIAAMILRQLKADAERWLGEPVTEAVLTVPAYYNDRQRRATREAAVLAGLTVPMLLNEPTAAALAYGLEREETSTILVWDLGGGTFDVSILELGEGIFEVLAVSGDGSLGGVDFDEVVAAHLAERYRSMHGSTYPDDPRSRARLLEAAEKLKLALSAAPSATASVPFVGPSPTPADLEVVVTREALERLVAGLVQRMVPPTRQALADARLDPAQLDLVILVGNGTKMPVVRKLATDLLGSEPYRYLDADLVTALGAAIQAGMISGRVRRAVLLDVLPLSLGVETKGGLFARIVPRNSTLPVSASQVFSTASDGQEEMRIEVVQGERELTSENVRLGHLELEGLAPAPRGVVKVEVAFDVDVDGIVHVRASDLLAGTDATARFVSSKQLDPEEIAHLVEEANAFADDDRADRRRIESRIGAESAIAAAEMALAAFGDGERSPAGLAIEAALWQVQEAVATGSPVEVRETSVELRRLLAEADLADEPRDLPSGTSAAREQLHLVDGGAAAPRDDL